MRFEDWRDAEASVLRELYEVERARWQEGLSWDFEASIRVIEEARAAGRLPGVLVRDREGRVAGWAYFIVHEGILQIGGMVGQTASVVRHLLDRVLEAPEAARARSLSAFLYPVSDSVRIAFERRRFAVQAHPYLSTPLAERPAPTVADGLVCRRIQQVEPADVVRLFARAYAGSPEARCFAPDGRLDQWAQYLGQLLSTPGCGSYCPPASFGLVRQDDHRLVGAVITTSLSNTTAHIAQVVVDPSAQRMGIARTLVGLASVAARGAGHTTLSLIVAESNQPARALYANLGFTERASFLYASRPALTRRVQVPTRERQVAGAV